MKLSGKQSRSARGLLKWNLHDLASKVKTPIKRLESFEKGVLHLQKVENDELINAYKKEGIEFRGDFEVVLKEKKEARNYGGETVTVAIDADELLREVLMKGDPAIREGSKDEPDAKTALKQSPAAN